MMALVFAVVMVLAMAVPAFAEEGDGDGGNTSASYTVTVTNATKGESYTIYKVFDAVTKTGRTDGGEGISYSSTWLTASNDYFDVDSKGNITIKDAGKKADGTLSDAAITWLKSQVSKFTAGETITASGTSVVFERLDDGYYYVTTTTGSFITVDSIAPNVEIQDKNTVPSGDKSQSAEEEGTYADTTLDLNIGDTVYYQYVITNGKGSDKEIKFTDTMTAGLDLNDTITVTGTKTISASDYTLTKNADGHGFVLTLKADYVKSMSATDTVTVKYSATINKNAVIDSATGNSNTGKLEYSEQKTEETIYVETYDFQLKKTDGTNFLDGAGFKLYDAETGGNQIVVSKDSTGYYVDAKGNAATEIAVDSAAGVNVRGLKPGTYYLEETTTPEGYNTLTSRETVTITSGATAAVQITVVNNAGTELPSTGGIGTTIFYILGSILVIGGGIMLISRKRLQK